MSNIDHQIHLASFAVGPLQCNCTIVGNLKSGEAIVVDPGGEASKIIDYLDAYGLKAVEVIHTHAHFDHFLASAELKASSKEARLGLHLADLPLWEALESQCQMFGLQYVPTPPPDYFIEDGASIAVKGCSCVALHTPGHTPGSTSFLFEEASTLVAGDTLFKQGIGRTDLWGGDAKAISKSIREILFQLEEKTEVIAGHGPSTTIGFEKENNPFVRN